MKPETLKKIAEAMGYDISEKFDFIPDPDTVYLGDCSATAFRMRNCDKFNPTSNPAQLLEVVKLLVRYGWHIKYNLSESYYYVCNDYMQKCFADESLETAIMLAAEKQVSTNGE